MLQDSGTTQPLWLDSGDVSATGGELAGHHDLVIIGAGIAGLSCAYQLCRRGQKVVVVDDGPPAGGETCRTTAHLASALDDRFTELERLHGEEGSRLAHASHAAAIDEIESIVSRENIECEFQRVEGYLVPAGHFTDEDMKAEHEAALRAGLVGARYPAECPVATLSARPAIAFPRQGQFDPIKYLSGLSKAIQRMGGTIITNTLVAQVKDDGDVVRITLDDHREVTAGNCIVATNAPIVSLEMQLKQAPYRTYAIAVEVPAGSVAPGLYWDTEDPYHYIRLQHGNAAGEADLLIVGGEDHRTGKNPHPQECFARLREWTKEYFPQAGKVRYEWSGQVLEPIDGLAFIGQAPGMKHVYISTGDSGMGMTHGTIASLMLPDLLEGKAHAWEDLYHPARRVLKALPTFIKENAVSVPQLGALVMPGEVKSAAEIANGSGAVIREGLHKIAVYKDEQGAEHRLTAVCNHLGCQVEWNDVEKSWDCPCHGSRFTCEGKVLNGPASKALEKA